MPSFKSPTPHFFKVILHRTLQQQKLEIPTKFVREYGVQALLSSKTCLKVADGREWNVGLAKSDGRVWFDDGWQKFVEFYSIGLEDFLMFRYERKPSSFRVVIFDNSTMEIEYPVKRIRLDRADGRVKMESGSDNLDLVFCSEEKALDFKVGQDSSDVDGKSMNIKHGGRKLPSTTSQRERAMVKATDFQSTTLNPSFVCKIWPSHLLSGKALHVPRSFTEMHLEGPVEVILEVSDGRTWRARCGMYYWNNRTRRMADLRNGWNKFARDNKLQVGDEIPKKFVREYNGVLVQALLSSKMCLKVADGREWNLGLAKSNGRVWFSDGWQKFAEFYSLGFGHFLVFRYESQSSSFHVVVFDISATEIEYPAKSIRLDKVEEMVKIESGGDNIDHMVIWLDDFKVGQDSFAIEKPMNGEDRRWMKLPSTASQRERAMAKATDFQSTTLNPCFMCKISHSHVYPGKSLHVPKSFAEMHLKLEGPVELNLEVPDGRIWNARCSFYGATHRIRRRTMLGSGWKRFARDNSLQVGDVCVFEMMRKNSRRISLKVYIFQAS
ncbi:B3 domain-containing transcription factor VRN1-like [Momordica charantia]|uniref:B3 domain-containing transcription factor VRN1-like n=1 Tax=Momordica charantia TaxID=3673 RepID=A0A6J1DYT9_MOMCH|nr:B3 domain-containing transcription factor VRN1-like [Momordica charantia]